MKHIYIALLLIATTLPIYAQTAHPADTAGITEALTDKPAATNGFQAIEQAAEYPGGINRFYAYIGGLIRTREVEELLGIKGKVKISFVIDTNGKLTNVKPISNIGSGCEEEVIKIVESCSRWIPAQQNGRKVNQTMTIPITFNFPVDTISMASLSKGFCGYLFQIKGTLYDTQHAAVILGEKFPASMIEIVRLYTEPEKFNLKKDEIWLVKIRS